MRAAMTSIIAGRAEFRGDGCRNIGEFMGVGLGIRIPFALRSLS
jgi:hypothetical protein